MDDSEYLRAEAQRCRDAATAAGTHADAERLTAYALEFERLAAAVEADSHIRNYLPDTGPGRTE